MFPLVTPAQGILDSLAVLRFLFLTHPEPEPQELGSLVEDEELIPVSVL